MKKRCSDQCKYRSYNNRCQWADKNKITQKLPYWMLPRSRLYSDYYLTDYERRWGDDKGLICNTFEPKEKI